MGGVCIMYTKSCSKTLKERDHLEDLGSRWEDNIRSNIRE